MSPSTTEAPAGSPALLHQYTLLGRLAWLWMNSPLQRDWDMSTAARFLLPPILHEQVELIERDGVPVAYCSWAWLDQDAELRYMMNPSAMRVEDWKSGDRLWFADWVAPFATVDSWSLRRRMMRRFPDQVARAIRVKRERKTARVMEFTGPALTPVEARERLSGYYQGFVQAFRQMKDRAGRPLHLQERHTAHAPLDG
jgi:cytolysin-activating lysine-acyltransferase